MIIKKNEFDKSEWEVIDDDKRNIGYIGFNEDTGECLFFAYSEDFSLNLNQLKKITEKIKQLKEAEE